MDSGIELPIVIHRTVKESPARNALLYNWATPTPTTMPVCVWYLDTSASNHMTGENSLFSELDREIMLTGCHFLTINKLESNTS